MDFLVPRQRIGMNGGIQLSALLNRDRSLMTSIFCQWYSSLLIRIFDPPKFEPDYACSSREENTEEDDIEEEYESKSS